MPVVWRITGYRASEPRDHGKTSQRRMLSCASPEDREMPVVWRITGYRASEPRDHALPMNMKELEISRFYVGDIRF